MNSRVRVAALAAALLCSPTSVRAQVTPSSLAGTAKLLQADFAVPDAPALKMLDGDASKLLRPVSVKALTAAISNASGDFSFIPRAFSVEFSPAMLANGERLSLDDYQASRIKYSTRLSFATKRDTGATARSQVAGAIRFSFDDASDFRTNASVIGALDSLTRFRVYVDSLLQRRLSAAGVPLVGTRNTEQQQKAKDVELQLTKEHAARNKALVDAVKQTQADALWNANVFDVALGARGSAADSTGSGMQFDGVAGWFTFGRAPARNWQVLLGARAAYERDLADTTSDDLKGAADVAVRTYAGSNRYKALGELQLTTRASEDAKWLGQVGGELALSDALWMEASLGYQAEGKLSQGKVVSSFKLKFTPPGT
jgi:hypothetical protein